MNIIENILPEKELVLTEARFYANNYTDYPEKVNLNVNDIVKIIEITETGFKINFKRAIKARETNFFDLSASFDIIFNFIEPYNKCDFISEDELLDIIINNENFFLNESLAKSSLIISQLSMQFNNSLPIITPAQLLVSE